VAVEGAPGRQMAVEGAPGRQMALEEAGVLRGPLEGGPDR
jgi:hypothetical protein